MVLLIDLENLNQKSKDYISILKEIAKNRKYKGIKLFIMDGSKN
jgi:hypothetical protein